MSVVDFTGGARCKDCGDQIEPARIRINPKALRCIECQEDMEIERLLIERLGDGLTNLAPGELTAQERDILWARDRLSRLKSLDQWLAERPRKEWEITLFKKAVAEIQKIACDGTQREIVAGAP